MKPLICTAAILLGLLSIDALAGYGDMDPDNCTPSGPINKVKASYDPLGFWVRVHIDATQAIEYLQDGNENDLETACAVNNNAKVGSDKFLACRKNWLINRAYWYKCQEFARKMCRQYGGLC